MSYLRPGGREDRNVNPWELVDFVNTQSSVRALTRMGGTLELLKQFLANEIPVVIETGFMPEGYDWLGHYRTLVAYDDSLGVFWVYDSFLGDGENGEGVALDYTGIDRDWKQFNRQFIVVYEPAREALVQTILGEYGDTRRAAEIARDTALAEAQADPSDADAWFNVGSALVALGDYERAANAYDLALREGLHWRTTFYQFGIYEAYYQTGRYAELLSLVDSSLSSGGVWVEETYYWQGRALAAQGRTADARTAFGMALNRNPSYQAARDARDALDS
jgi:tetratricopeptide (TPR) repeat protein